MHPAVHKAITESLDCYGNPSTPSDQGKRAKAVIDDANESIKAHVFGVPPECGLVVWTGSGTEGNHTAVLLSLLQDTHTSHTQSTKKNKKARAKNPPHVVTTTVEHPAILKHLASLEDLGLVSVTRVKPRGGEIVVEDVAEAVGDTTVLVTVIRAQVRSRRGAKRSDVHRSCWCSKLISAPHFRPTQNETGYLADVAGIAKAVKAVNPRCLVHSDAAQAASKVDCRVSEGGGLEGVDLITVVGHKLGAPKGVAALYVADSVSAANVEQGGVLLKGGGQMKGLRSGTENVPYIAGMGAAAKEVAAGLRYVPQYRRVVTRLLVALQGGLPEGVEAVFNCGSDSKGLPQTLSVGFRGAPGLTSGHIMRECMDRGVIVAAGSACDANKKEVDYSQILKEFGVGAEVGVSTLRVSCGFWNTEEEGELVGRTVADVVSKYVLDSKK